MGGFPGGSDGKIVSDEKLETDSKHLLAQQKK